MATRKDAQEDAQELSDGDVVWLRTTSLREWEVEVGTDVYIRLIAEGAQIITGPSEAGE